MTVALQHPFADVSRYCHDYRIRLPVLGKLSDGAVPEVVKPETLQACSLGEGTPCRAPALDVARRFPSRHDVIHDALSAGCELGGKSRKYVVRQLYWPESLRATAQLRQHSARYGIERHRALSGIRLALLDRQDAPKQVHVSPLQTF